MPFTNNHCLTMREIDILLLIAEGKKNVHIGENLFISPNTVRASKTHLLKKLNFKYTTELICFAVSNKRKLDRIQKLILGLH